MTNCVLFADVEFRQGTLLLAAVLVAALGGALITAHGLPIAANVERPVHAITIPADRTGRFYVQASIGGVAYRCLIDTSVRDVLVPQSSDERSRGAEPVSSITVGDLAAVDLPVTKDEVKVPRLGANWLGHFHVEIAAGVMTLSDE
jgi:hypothetical protein